MYVHDESVGCFTEKKEWIMSVEMRTIRWMRVERREMIEYGTNVTCVRDSIGVGLIGKMMTENWMRWFGNVIGRAETEAVSDYESERWRKKKKKKTKKRWLNTI